MCGWSLVSHAEPYPGLSGAFNPEKYQSHGHNFTILQVEVNISKYNANNFRIIWNQFICNHEKIDLPTEPNASAVSGVARRQWRKWRLPRPILRWKTKLPYVRDVRVPWNYLDAWNSHKDDFQEWDLLFSNDRIIPRFHILVFSGRGAG